MLQVEGCQPGRRASLELRVEQADTAEAIGSGDVPVLATPRVLALAERAAVAAIGDCLGEERTSVGAHVELDHEKPTLVGATVRAEAVLIGVHGRRLELSIEVLDDSGERIAHVRHQRVIVDRAKFLPPSGGAR